MCLAVEGSGKSIMPRKLESTVNIPRTERFRLHVGERWAATAWERYEGRKKGMELRFTLLNRWPATLMAFVSSTC